MEIRTTDVQITTRQDMIIGRRAPGEEARFPSNQNSPSPSAPPSQRPGYSQAAPSGGRRAQRGGEAARGGRRGGGGRTI